jgi:hypothetical protein
MTINVIDSNTLQFVCAPHCSCMFLFSLAQFSDLCSSVSSEWVVVGRGGAGRVAGTKWREKR